MKLITITIALLLTLAGCGGGDPLDCVPADFIGPIAEDQVRCDA